MTHIRISKLTVISTDNGLSLCWRQAIVLTNAIILLIGPLGTNFSVISIKIDTFSFQKMHLKMSSGKWQPFCLNLNVLRKQTPMIISSCLNYFYRNMICRYESYKTYENLIWFNIYYWYFVHTIRWCFASYWNNMIIWGSFQCKYRIIYGLPWIMIFVSSQAILIQQWFSCVKKSHERKILPICLASDKNHYWQ